MMAEETLGWAEGSNPFGIGQNVQSPGRERLLLAPFCFGGGGRGFKGVR
jgi:hypothetical protein